MIRNGTQHGTHEAGFVADVTVLLCVFVCVLIWGVINEKLNILVASPSIAWVVVLCL